MSKSLRQVIVLIFSLVGLAWSASGCIPLLASGRGMDAYQAYLNGQDGRRRDLPKRFTAAFQKYYNFPLSDVTILDSVDTISGEVVTLNHKIYLPSSVNFDNAAYVERILHEFTHVEQQDHLHNNFYMIYVGQTLNALVDVTKQSSWSIKSIHDNLKLESEAESKAQGIMTGNKSICPDGVHCNIVSSS